PEDALQGEQELEEETAVEVHRARDVAEQEQADLLALALAEAEVDQVALRQVRPERAPQIHAAAPPHRAPPARDPVGEAPRELERQAQDLVELLGAEGREVPPDERFRVRGRGHAQGLAGVVPLVLVRAPRVERQRLALLARRLERGVALPRLAGRDLEEPGDALAVRRAAPERLEA